MVGVEMKRNTVDIDVAAKREADRAFAEWRRLEEAKAQEAVTSAAFALADTVITVARIASALGVNHEDAAAIYISVSTGLGKVLGRNRSIS
jgi:hypothetical protein